MNEAKAFLDKYISGLSDLWSFYVNKRTHYVETLTDWCKEKSFELHSVWHFDYQASYNSLGILFNDGSLIYFKRTNSIIHTHKYLKDGGHVAADFQLNKAYNMLFAADVKVLIKAAIPCGGCKGTGKVTGFLMTTVYECGRCGGKGLLEKV